MRHARALFCLACVLWGGRASAQIDLRGFDPAQAFRDVSPFSSQLLAGGRPISALIEFPEGADPTIDGFRRADPRFGVARGTLAELADLARAHPDWRVTWSPPFHPLLDRAAAHCHAPEFRNQTGRTGRNVVVGIVDTGIDVFHADFRNPDGTTRIAYLVDFSSPARGTYPEAEALCPQDQPCGVFTKAEIDGALAVDDHALLPKDTSGHGTHVTSLAAGNGGPAARYVGIAPAADLIVVRAIDPDGNLTDATIEAGAQLIFWLAEQEGQKRGVGALPTAVNISLGSDFGAHDGSNPVERALANLVGPTHPGRVIVVAAGNGAGVYRFHGSYPDPLGIHTVVNVTEGSHVTVPVVLDPLSLPTIQGGWYAWISFHPGDDLRIGLDRDGDTWIAPQSPGAAKRYSVNGGELIATVVTGKTSALGSQFDDTQGGAVGLEGTWLSTQKFAITFEGHGTASLWLQSSGDLSPEAGSAGALFPGATKDSTIAVPGNSAEVITVGAAVNRIDWTDRAGEPIAVARLGSILEPSDETIAYFSGAGPTSDGRLKPDLVSTGAFVAGAMSADADPLVQGGSIFAGSSFCTPPDDCAVVDNQHAVTLGTSMAAPLVTGAAALLLQGDPSLTSNRVLARLQAGAHYPLGTVPFASQIGAGALDLMGSLDVENLEAQPAARDPSNTTSWLTLGAETARPDPSSPIPAVLQLRDATGLAASGVRPEDLEIGVERGRLTRGPDAPAPGFVTFAVAANADTGGDTLSVEIRWGGRVLANRSVPIAVDVNAARRGFFARGGCTMDRAEAHGPTSWVSLLGLTLLAASRRTSAARRVRNPGRTGGKDRARRGSFRR